MLSSFYFLVIPPTWSCLMAIIFYSLWLKESTAFFQAFNNQPLDWFRSKFPLGFRVTSYFWDYFFFCLPSVSWVPFQHWREEFCMAWIEIAHRLSCWPCLNEWCKIPLASYAAQMILRVLLDSIWIWIIQNHWKCQSLVEEDNFGCGYSLIKSKSSAK